jgi:hypothetical protein
MRYAMPFHTFLNPHFKNIVCINILAKYKTGVFSFLNTISFAGETRL